jgi:hypothetical protein
MQGMLHSLISGDYTTTGSSIQLAHVSDVDESKAFAPFVGLSHLEVHTGIVLTLLGAKVHCWDFVRHILWTSVCARCPTNNAPNFSSCMHPF